MIFILFSSTTVVATCLRWTHRIFTGGLHDLAEANADSLPLVALVRAQPLLQDGNNLRENLLSQLPHQISQGPSSDLKPHRVSKWYLHRDNNF